MQIVNQDTDQFAYFMSPRFLSFSIKGAEKISSPAPLKI